MRWEHPEHGLISPARFIPVAEDTGAIVELGEWVGAEAGCGQVAAWTDALGTDRLVLSVNLSRRQLDDPRIVSVVEDVLADTGLDPGRLCLEITETAVMRDFALSVRVLSAVRALGVRLAIDDFGWDSRRSASSSTCRRSTC